MSKIYSLIFGGIFIISMIAGGYYYISQLQTKLTFAEKELASALAAYEQQEKVFQNLQEQLKAQKVLREELQVRLNKARSKSNVMRKTLSKHDLEKIAKRKPGLLQKRMRSATLQLFSELEQATQ